MASCYPTGCQPCDGPIDFPENPKDGDRFCIPIGSEGAMKCWVWDHCVPAWRSEGPVESSTRFRGALNPTVSEAENGITRDTPEDQWIGNPPSPPPSDRRSGDWWVVSTAAPDGPHPDFRMDLSGVAIDVGDRVYYDGDDYDRLPPPVIPYAEEAEDATPDPDNRVGGIVRLASVEEVQEGTNKCNPVTPYTLNGGLGDGEITINQNGTEIGSFTVNQSNDTSIDIDLSEVLSSIAQGLTGIRLSLNDDVNRMYPYIDGTGNNGYSGLTREFTSFFIHKVGSGKLGFWDGAKWVAQDLPAAVNGKSTLGFNFVKDGTPLSANTTWDIYLKSDFGTTPTYTVHYEEWVNEDSPSNRTLQDGHWVNANDKTMRLVGSVRIGVTAGTTIFDPGGVYGGVGNRNPEEYPRLWFSNLYNTRAVTARALTGQEFIGPATWGPLPAPYTTADNRGFRIDCLQAEQALAVASASIYVDTGTSGNGDYCAVGVDINNAPPFDGFVAEASGANQTIETMWSRSMPHGRHEYFYIVQNRSGQPTNETGQNHHGITLIIGC